MGHIIMPAFAFRTALSEDAGVRSGFAFTEANMLAHLPVENHLREGLVSDTVLRVQSEGYGETAGDLLHAVGAAEQPGMLTLGMRLMRLLDRDWRDLFSIDTMLELEAVASH